MESGRANPSTEVALRLARALGSKVDSLFHLADEGRELVQAKLAEGSELRPGYPGAVRVPRTRLVDVGHRLVAWPVAGPAATRYSLVEAEGVIVSASDDQASVRVFDDVELDTPSLGILGCDPAVALLEPGLLRYGVRLAWAEVGSYQALASLARGEAHVAGCHLQDENSGAYNLGWVRRIVPFPATLITFAAWHQGFITTPTKSSEFRTVEDLVNDDVIIVNREAGSGSRSLLDRMLQQKGIAVSEISGYQYEVGGHLAVAGAVAAGVADVGIGIEAAAEASGLAFVPLEEERYDLVIPNHLMDEAGVQVLLNLLRRPEFRRRVESLGGYDVSQMGDTVPAP